MGLVEFDEQDIDYRTRANFDSRSFMVKMVGKLGVPPEYANYALVVVSLIFFALSIAVIVF